MRILASASIILLASALSLPSAACDRHGAGGFYGQFNGATWSDYNPPLSESDILLEEEDSLSAWEKLKAVRPAAAPSKKPTFSKVSSRASDAAKARLAARAKLARLENDAAETSENSESASASAILNVGR